MGGRKGGLRGVGGGMTRHVQHMCPKSPFTHKSRIFRGWADGRGVYIPRNRSSVSSSLIENYSPRLMPSLCEI
jgi:hypothetical protein